MTPTQEYVAAVDIGTTKIVAIIGRREKNGKIRIIGTGKAMSKGVKRGVVLNIEETAASIQEAVKQARDQSGINFDQVFVGIAGQHIKSIKNRGYRYIESQEDEIAQEDVDILTSDMYKIPLEAGEEIIHVIPQNYIVDSETGVKNPVGMTGKRLEANFHIVIGHVASAKNTTKCINRLGMQVQRLILEPLASSDAVLTDDEKEAGVALLDIGGGTTDVAVYYDGIIRHTAVIPFGGNVITNDIKEGCAILQRQAELLKVQFGSALGDLAPDDKVVTIPGINGRDPKEISFKSLAFIIQARMEEIIDAVAFELENSGFMDKLGAGIALTGGGALLKHLPQLVKFKTGLDVRVGFPNENFVFDTFKEINQPPFSTSVGLILKGFEYLDEMQKMQQIKPVEKVVVAVEKEEKKVETYAPPKKQSLISTLKENIIRIFEEKDTKM